MAPGSRERKARSLSERDLAPLRRLVARGWEGVDPVVVLASLSVACPGLVLVDRVLAERNKAGGAGVESPLERRSPRSLPADEMIQAHGVVARLVTRTATARVLAVAGIGSTVVAGIAQAAEPRPWQLGFQPPATPVQARIEAFNNELTVIIGLITAFVLGLLVYTIVRFNQRRHPVPTRTSHNTVLEIMWTVVPVLILIIIAIPSFKLMYFMDRVPDQAMTIKVTGHQWYWSYEYPDEKGLAFDSNMVQDANLKPGQPRLLTVDNPLVVPVDTNVRVQITSTDVMHLWFVPSFGVQEYAIIGRVNESWFRVEHEGTYRGQCDQLCGINHAFMPIEVKAVSKDAFEHWVVDAKKQFSDDNTQERAVRVAATAGAPGVARAASAGN